MAVTDKNIVITPNNGNTTAQPNIAFTGCAAIPMSLNVADDNSIYFSNCTGQLFSIASNTTSGSIFTVSDISGIPAINVDASGNVCLSPYGGNVTVGSTTVTSATPTTVGFMYGLTCSTSIAGNTSVGYGALQNTTVTGICNTAVGWNSLNANTTGNTNTAVGFISLSSNTVGSNNVGVGGFSLSCNTSGGYNTALGVNSMLGNVTGCNNTALGFQTLLIPTASRGNVAVGAYSMSFACAGDCNIAIGFNTLTQNVSGSRNIAIGDRAMWSTSNCGTANIAIGPQTLTSNTTGNNNIGIGFNALCGNSGGQCNVALGYGSGSAITSSYNVVIGGHSGVSAAVTGSNNVVISDGQGCLGAWWQGGVNYSSNGWIQANNATAWSQTSDCRIKKCITPITDALDIISSLNPVCFKYRKNDRDDVGFIAQEYQKVLPEQVKPVDTNSFTDEMRYIDVGDKLLTITPNIVPYLVRAVQELQSQISSLNQEIMMLKDPQTK